MATVTGYRTGDFFDLKNAQIMQVTIEGESDATDALLINPAGDESAPKKDDRIPVLRIGNFRLAIGGIDGIAPTTAEGEKRLYSRDSNGNVAAQMLLDANGNIEMNGDSKRFVTYAELDAALQSHITKYNSDMAFILAGATAAIAASGLWLTPLTGIGTTNLDISASKTTTIKTDG